MFLILDFKEHWNFLILAFDRLSNQELSFLDYINVFELITFSKYHLVMFVILFNHVLIDHSQIKELDFFEYIIAIEHVQLPADHSIEELFYSIYHTIYQSIPCSLSLI